LAKTAVLDDLVQIRKIDKNDMLSFCLNAYEHYGKAGKLGGRVSVDFGKPQTIIVAGMGGSAIGGELLKDWAEDRITVPIEVCRGYSLPRYAGKHTLVFVVSYSGETEESLSVFLDAIKRKCTIVCISSGGELLKFAEKLSVANIRVPPGMAPRATLPYLFIPSLSVLEKVGLVSSVYPEISEAVKVLRLVGNENSPVKPLNSNFSKTLAAAISGTVPVVYGFSFYRSVAQRFKTQFNENSKVPAKWEFFPELNHNEIVGWEEIGSLSEHFSVILIRDVDEPIEICQRIEITKELIHEKTVRLYEIWSKGKSRLAKMCSTVCVGDFTSVYLALLHGVDPTPVRTIGLLKERLTRTGLKARVVLELENIAGK
jgi:glucose/mannose-6-phosphate isomerase